MSVSGMTVGVDYSIQYYESNSGTLITIADIQNVRIKAGKHTIKSMPYNAPSRYGYVPDGYTINFTVTRTSSILEDLAVLNEANFNAGAIQTPGILNQTITNPDGTKSIYQYTNFVIFLDDHGDISREKTVNLALEGMASTKVSLAAAT